MSLNSDIAKAKAEVAKDSHLVQVCQKRVDKFKRHHAAAKKARNAARKHRQPAKIHFYEDRMARNSQKIRFWTKREADAIEVNKSAKATLARLLGKKAALQPNGGKLVATAKRYEGTQEGSALQVKWAHDLGYSSSLPWCSIFAANMLLESGTTARAQLPSNPAYSGAWIGWGHGRRVNVSNRRPGDLLIFDWGDGGLTDHVAICVDGGHHIGGNQSNEVSVETTPVGNIVAVIRPL